MPLGAGTVGAMAVGKRARLTLDERRAQLVELGADVFRDRPYDEVSIDDITAAAGVSRGLLYHYFDGKRDFYVAALRHAAEEIEALTEPDEDLAPEERLRAAIEGYLDYVEQHAAGYASVLRAGSGVDPAVAAVIEGVRERMGERVLRELPGDQGDAPAVRLAVRAWIGFAEAASLAWAERGGIDRAGLGDLLTAVLGTALARTAAAAP
jgi:AcrR family transcriptional regulator